MTFVEKDWTKTRKNLMIKIIKAAIVSLFFLIISINYSSAQPEDWVIDVLDNPAPGYLRIDFNMDYGFFLMDNYGEPKYIDSSNNGNFANLINYKLLPDGNWSCVSNGTFLILNQNHEILDTLKLPANIDYYDSHDILQLPNGRFIVSAYN